MSETPFKRLILRAVLRDVYPMVIRLVAVPDYLELADFDDVFHAVLGWESGIGYAFQVHGQEFNSFRRRTRAKRLRDFGLHRQEKFLYTLGTRCWRATGRAGCVSRAKSWSCITGAPGVNRPALQITLCVRCHVRLHRRRQLPGF